MLSKNLNHPSLLTQWSSVFIFLKINNLQSKLNIDLETSNDNLLKIADFLYERNQLCENVFFKFNINSDNKSYMKSFLYKFIFTDEILKVVSMHFKWYCEVLISTFATNNGNVEIPTKEAMLLISNAVERSVIDIEDVYVEEYKTVMRNYMVDQIRDEKESNESVLQNLFSLHENSVENKVLPMLFPRRYSDGGRRIDDVRFSKRSCYQLYFDVVMENIYEVVMAYPCSHKTLLDVGCCVRELGCGRALCQQLQHHIRERLINPAVPTTDLITAYICVIKSLRAVSPTFVFEEIVTPDIRGYLLKRDDTTKAIVDKILFMNEDTCVNSVYSDLFRPSNINIVAYSGASEAGNVECSFDEMDSWQPDPWDTASSVEAEHDLLQGSSGGAISESQAGGSLWPHKLDVLSLLLSIYNSRELFASEYKELLSQRLIRNMASSSSSSTPDNVAFGAADLEKELRNLETLKMKFGAHNFKDCDVMLRDIRDSRKVNSVVMERLQADEAASMAENTDPQFDITAHIISAEYWARTAVVSDKTFCMPNHLQNRFDQFSRNYSDHKRNRQLRWQHSLGCVSLEVEVAGQPQRMEVRPLQAAIVHLFSEQACWLLSALAQKLVVNLSEARRGVGFWLKKCVLKREQNTEEAYSVLEAGDSSSPLGAGAGSSGDRRRTVDMEMDLDCDEDDGQQRLRDREARLNENLWFMVKFMLKLAQDKKQSLSMDRIFAMIPFYSHSDPISITRDQLQAFIDRKVAEKLICAAPGHKCYKLNQP